MSDPLTGSNTLEQWVDDALTVLDAAGSRRTAFFGTDPAGAVVATMFAASHPERTTRLVLFNGATRFLWSDDYPWGWPAEELERRLDAVVDRKLTGSIDPTILPSAEADDEFRRWRIRAQRRGLSPLRTRAAHEAIWRSDLRPVLDTITTPTLLLYREVGPAATNQHGDYLAAHLRDARLITLSGTDALPFLGDVVGLVAEVQEFLTGARSEPVPDRILATVLFSDIVDSTAQATSLGDRTWTERLDAHDALVRRELQRFRGREIKTTGDGFLATFDGPARAIRSACAIRDGAQTLGISVRVGLHTGEVEVRRDDIGGIAVHTAARVQGRAEPGEVCVSRTVVDLVAGSGITFDDRGEHELKGVTGAWRLFAVASSQVNA